MEFLGKPTKYQLLIYQLTFVLLILVAVVIFVGVGIARLAVRIVKPVRFIPLLKCCE